MISDKKIMIVGNICFDYILTAENIITEKHISRCNYQKFLGGCGANISIGIAKLGGNCQLVSAVGEDFINSNYEKYLMTAGVNISSVQVINGKKTSKAFIFTNNGDSQLTYFYWGASVCLKKVDLYPIDFVHLTRTNFDLIYSVSKIANFISFDFSDDFVLYPDQINLMLKRVNILFLNEFELSKLCMITKKSVSDLADEIDIIVVTFGSKGSEIYTKYDRLLIPAVSVNSIDSTGAGDAYRAGFLLAYYRGYPLEICGKIGATVSSFVVEEIGSQSNCPTWDKMRLRFEEHFGVLGLIPA